MTTLPDAPCRLAQPNNVFRYLIQDRLMCDTRIARDIFSGYVNLVREHMEQVDRDLCSRLLSHEVQTVRNTADRFLSGSSEIKRIFADYLRQYCSDRRNSPERTAHQGLSRFRHRY